MRNLQNIALIGFMGTGKSTVGRQVAAQLHFEFLDTDEEIERNAGKSIPQIFSQDGEEAFRSFERSMVERLAELKFYVFSTGGGLGARSENIEKLKTHSLVVCLWASPKTIWDRVKNQNHRPLLHDPNPFQKIERLLEEREPVYKTADVLIGTELRSVKEISQNIVHQFLELKQRNS